MAKVSHLSRSQTKHSAKERNRISKTQGILEFILLNQKQFVSDNNQISIPSLVTSEDCHGQRFSSVVIINKTWRQEKKQDIVIKHKACWSSIFVKNNLCQVTLQLR